jgi:hypothetical protein
MLVSNEQNAGQNHKITVSNKSFETVEHSIRTLTYQNSIPEETKNRLKEWNACILRCRIFLSTIP